jgi:hypothetical protein
MLGGYWGGSWIHNYDSKKIKDLILAYKHDSKKFEKNNIIGQKTISSLLVLS